MLINHVDPEEDIDSEADSSTLYISNFKFVKYSLTSISYCFELVDQTKNRMFEKKKAIMKKSWLRNPFIT